MFCLGSRRDRRPRLGVDVDRHDISGPGPDRWTTTAAGFQLLDVVLLVFDLVGDGVEIPVG